jgi:teichuronic acid biosynthesis glycosyltransferase TuaG
MVLVSVIMLSYNHEKYVSDAIDSVLSQTFRDFECIIIDDCSKDNSKEIIRNYQRKDQRIRAFFHKTNMGIAPTKNDGLAEAKGKFIAFIDSDDIWIEKKLEMQLLVLRDDESLIVWSEGEIINESGIPTGKTFTQVLSAQNKKKSGDLFEELLHGNFIFASSVILKSDYAKENQFCEELRYFNDYKFMIDLSKDHSFFFSSEPLAKYRIHGKNAISSDKEGWIRDGVIVYTYILQKYDSFIPNRIKANLLLMVGWEYSYLGNKVAARRAIFKAISLDLFRLFRREGLFSLGLALTNGEDNIARFFNKIRFYYHGLITCATKRALGKKCMVVMNASK